ncbi:branched-chain amino acid ABC transporter, permease protein [Acetobacteraceae bacterium AT-5844]|nr:branched-chain amino acid ABC transporter, permease protein [Acetobacteraceae bacterium AT-5844]
MNMLRWLLPALAVAACIAVAPAMNEYILYIATMAALMCILAVSYNVLLGFTGYLSLAHGFLYGVGAYAGAQLTTAGWSFWLALPVAGLVAAALGALVALAAFRTKGLYFAVLTLGIGLVGFQLFLVLEPLTGGVGGFVGIPSMPSLPGLEETPSLNALVITLPVLGATFYAAMAFQHSALGAACLAVREDVLLAQALGIRIGSARLAAFTFSAFFAGIAGALFAALSNFVGPDTFAVTATGFQVVVFVVVGGMGLLWGSVLGAVALTALPEVLRGAATFSVLVYGALLLAAVLFAPQGLGGLLLDGWRRWRPAAAPRLPQPVKAK